MSMLRNKRMIVLVPASALLWSLCAVVEARQSSAGVRIGVQTLAEVVQHEPILVRMSIWNRLDEALEFDLGAGWTEHVRIHVTGPDGEGLSRVPRDWISGTARRGQVRLDPGMTVSHQYVLNEWFMLEEPGTYQVQISVDAMFRTGGGTVVNPARTHLLHVTVAPYDEARLREVCERLAERVIIEPTARARIEAASALGHVNHPIVVPHLRRVAQEAMAPPDSTIIRALLRIGTLEAREALVEMLNSSDPLRLQMVADALQRFQLRQW